MNDSDKGSWIFTLLVGGGTLAISIAVFWFSYLKLRTP